MIKDSGACKELEINKDKSYSPNIFYPPLGAENLLTETDPGKGIAQKFSLVEGNQVIHAVFFVPDEQFSSVTMK